MAVELLPSQGLVSLDNWIMSSTLVGPVGDGGQAALYPARNLLNPLRSKRTRTLLDVATDWVFDLGTERLPTMFAVVDANINNPIYNVTVFGANDSALSSGVLIWSFVIYKQATVNKILRYYLGAPNSGVAAPRRFWGLEIDSGASDGAGYQEVGVFWLGTYTTMDMDRGMSVKMTDPTRVARSYNGAKYPDPLPPFHEVSWQSTNATDVASLTLKDTIDALGATTPVILDIYGNTTDTQKKAEGTFYGYFKQTPYTYTHPTSYRSADIKFDFEEAQE